MNVTIPSFKCSCGADFTRQSYLTRHETKCGENPTPGSVINSNNTVNNIGTQNVMILNFGTTMSGLTPEQIRDRVLDAISIDSIENGIQHMCEEVTQSVFTNEKGNCMIRIADASRKKLVWRTDKGEEPDPGAKKTATILRQPLAEAATMALEQTNKRDNVISTMSALNDPTKYQKEARRGLLLAAPARFENNHVSAVQVAPDGTLPEISRILKREERRKEKEKAEAKLKWENEILDRAQDLHDGTFWHPEKQWVVAPSDEVQFMIVGRRRNRCDETAPLNRSDLLEIGRIGLEEHLKPE
jgi:hypothetical protein